MDQRSLVYKEFPSVLRDKYGVFDVDQKNAEFTELWYTDDLNESTRLRLDGPGALNTLAPITLHSMFVKTVQGHSDHIALRYKYNADEEYKELTFKEYYMLSCQAAKSFIKLGLEERCSVCIAGFNAVPWHVSYFGAIFCNSVSSGVYTTNNVETIAYIINNCKCEIAIVESDELTKKYLEASETAPSLKVIIQYGTDPVTKSTKTVSIYGWQKFLTLGIGIPNESLHARLSNLIPNQCCSLIYTSGTTGLPKGVMMSHDNLCWTSAVLQNSMTFVPCKEYLISYLPLSHVAAQICDIILPLSVCAITTFAMPDALKGTLGISLKEIRPTYFIGVPRVFEKIMEQMQELGANLSGYKKSLSTWAKDIGLKHNLAKMNHEPSPIGWFSLAIARTLVYNKVKGRLGFDRCKGAFSAAAPISLDTLHYFASLDIIICEIYGMSECSGPQTVGQHDSFRFGSVGVTLADLRMKLEKQSATEDGEICMYGRHVFMGYVKALEKTKEVFDKNYYLHSGDLGKVDKDGYLFVTGRIKELIITAGGENIAPVPIEEAIKANIPFISNVMVIGDKRKFLSCIVTIKCIMDDEKQIPTDRLHQSVIRWCEENNYKNHNNSVKKFINDKQACVVKALDIGLVEANKVAISKAAHVQKWHMLIEDFSVGNGELGPTLKVKRNVVLKKYETEIDKIYTD